MTPRRSRPLPFLSLAIAAALWACTESGQDNSHDEAIAVVNGEKVVASEVRAALLADLRDRPGAEGEPQATDSDRKRVLDELIDSRLLAQAARHHEIRVRDDEVERRMRGMRADYPDEAFQAMLDREELSVEGLEALLSHQLLVERLFQREVFARVAVTDEEISAWIEENRDAFQRPERVRAAQIVVKTEEEARSLLAELRKGAAFAELARNHSLSPDARQGGELGWFGAGEMPPPFEEACFRLRPGQLSEVVESPYGFHLFQVLDRKSAHTPPEDELREEVEALMRRRKEAEAQEHFLAELRSKARIHIHTAALARLAVKN